MGKSAEEVVGLGIDAEVARHGAATEQDGVFHARAVGKGEFDGALQAAREKSGGGDDDAWVLVAGGAFDFFAMGDEGAAGDELVIAIAGAKAHGFAIGGDGDLFGVEGGGAGSAIGLGDDGWDVEVGEGDPFVAADEQSRLRAELSRQLKLGSEICRGERGKRAIGLPCSVFVMHQARTNIVA